MRLFHRIRNAQNYLQCFFEQLDFVDDAGAIDEEKTFAVWSADAAAATRPRIRQTIKECHMAAGENLAVFYRCIYQMA